MSTSATGASSRITVGAYARTSTRKQDLEGQRRALKEWAGRHGHELKLFEDDHVSGRRSDRAGVEALLGAAESGDIQLVAVVELSRLGRSIGFVHQTVERLSKKDVKVVLVSTGTVLDYETLEGRALIGALALAADIEWKLISERNARGRATIKARGVKCGPKAIEVSSAALTALLEKNLSVREIAKELKVSPATVTRRLRALRLAATA
jgi:DNA invertase Pin-like site-specific DNA recombinase